MRTLTRSSRYGFCDLGAVRCTFLLRPPALRSMPCTDINTYQLRRMGHKTRNAGAGHHAYAGYSLSTSDAPAHPTLALPPRSATHHGGCFPISCQPGLEEGERSGRRWQSRCKAPGTAARVLMPPFLLYASRHAIRWDRGLSLNHQTGGRGHRRHSGMMGQFLLCATLDRQIGNVIKTHTLFSPELRRLRSCLQTACQSALLRDLASSQVVPWLVGLATRCPWGM